MHIQQFVFLFKSMVACQLFLNEQCLIMQNKLTTLTRIVAATGALLLLLAIVLPVWRIELSAPQYPEGLVLQIYSHKLGGDVEVVNGLNHYIGMRTLHEKDFIEFQVLPYIIGTLSFFGLLAVLVNRKWFYYAWAGFFVLFAVTAMIDFYRWEYNYGHNLDPAAPIQVPGQSYQPPLIGYKQLLNFGAYSIPDSGGWILFGVGLLLVATAAYEMRRSRIEAKSISMRMATAAIVAMIVLAGCSSGPQPIKFGTDACDFCKMTIMDKRFGGELVTSKGKVYKFDDIGCIKAHMRNNKIDATVYLVDFAGDGQLVKSTDALLLESELIRGPMGGSIAAFANADSFRVSLQQLNGKQTSWNDNAR